MGIALATRGRACPCPVWAAWLLLPPGVGTHPRRRCSPGWYHLSSSEGRGLAGHLPTLGEPAACEGMAGEGVRGGLCWSLPPPHLPPRVPKVQVGPLALGAASNEASTGSERVGRAGKARAETPVAVQEEKGAGSVMLGTSPVSPHRQGWSAWWGRAVWVCARACLHHASK